MIPISNLTLNISEGSTIASTNIYGVTTYINIGSGNVFKLEWGTPTLTDDDTVDHYNLVIKRHDTVLGVYYNILDKNIGLVNEFYVDSAMLPALPLQYMLSIYLVAYGKNGSIITSNIVNPYVSKGSGSYIKTEADTKTPSIWKRALAFVNAPTEQYKAPVVLLDAEGNELYAAGSDDPLTADATRILTSDTWSVVQENYIKDDNGAWQPADISGEVLLVLKSGTTDEYEIVEVWNNSNDRQAEPLYVL